ncbi:MAG: thiamine phosphate synthase, partial [Phycisphaerae bacterium]|nr:thiamine phosphate synthase [Phycisphaerae bacterium]
MDRNVARIIDANLNRAREALRVLEDYARFGLDDAAASKTLKRLRHALSAAEACWPIAERVAARDTPRDVGTRIRTRREATRGSVADIVTAAAKRLTEALRVIEEYAKLHDARTAATVEQIRYAAYEVEKRLVLAAARPLFDHVRLYVLITESLCRGPWLRTARQAIAGGADCLQLREKNLDDGELLRRARTLVE